MNKKFYIIISSSNKHLGLFDDLENREDVEIKQSCLKSEVGLFNRICRKICFSLNLHGRYKWYNYGDIIKCSDIGHLLILDTAMVNMDLDFLNKIKKKGINVFLFLINSIDADSPMLKLSMPKINTFDFDKIYSFDSEDCKRYGFDYMGFNYYSKHKLPIRNDHTDAFFIGSIKGGRGKLIKETYIYLKENGVNVSFDVRSLDKSFYVDGMNFLTGEWISYEKVLQSVSNTNCIIEIMQTNQSGASLRYFEAVVYNKKLLTNNKLIVNFPYYDDRYMKIYSNPSDIDLDWLKSNETVDYHYKEDFSPNYLVNKFIHNKK